MGKKNHGSNNGFGSEKTKKCQKCGTKITIKMGRNNGRQKIRVSCPSCGLRQIVSVS